MIEIEHKGPEKLLLGVIHAAGLDPLAHVAPLETRLGTLLEQRAKGLDADEDARRARIRDVFRNGSYKPTGRAKPASEYLVRAAAEGTFPRINTLVDACNTASLAWLVPISILDVGRAGTRRFSVRLGREDESYVFNSAGQEIQLKDLIVGCADDRPVVNAVKDSMDTKTTKDTAEVLVLVYGLNEPGASDTVRACCEEFASFLEMAGARACSAFRVVEPGGTVRVEAAYGGSD